MKPLSGWLLVRRGVGRWWPPVIAQASDRRLMVRCASGGGSADRAGTGSGRPLPSRTTGPVPSARTCEESDRPPVRTPCLNPAYPAPIALQTLYVVVNPPPRYEIVGLLQQRSYTPVNEFFSSGDRELPAERALAKNCKSLLLASDSRGVRGRDLRPVGVVRTTGFPGSLDPEAAAVAADAAAARPMGR